MLLAALSVSVTAERSAYSASDDGYSPSGTTELTEITVVAQKRSDREGKNPTDSATTIGSFITAQAEAYYWATPRTFGIEVSTKF